MDSQKSLFPVPKTKFLKVKCNCGNEQVIFSAATTGVKCLSCGTQLAQNAASRAIIKAKIIKEFN